MQDLLKRSVRGNVKANCFRINAELYDQRVLMYPKFGTDKKEDRQEF